MNRTETIKILAVLKVAYPNSFSNMADGDLQVLINLWCGMFSDETYDDVDRAVRIYIATNSSGFAPTIGQIKAVMVGEQEMTAQEASNLLVSAISRSGWHAQEEFDKLPTEIRNVVGSPEMLRQWAAMDAVVVNSVVVSNFQRSYNAAVKRERQYKRIPSSIREKVESLAIQLRLTEG